MRSLRIPREPVRHLPTPAFIQLVSAKSPQPDPVPTALFFAAVLFSLSAFLAL
jgi:hypothetical protein